MDMDYITNPFLKKYLAYTDNTESPKLMHIWSAISGASAAMGRHIYLPFGIGDIYPNLFILLVGPPGTRKSQSIKYTTKCLKKTNIRFAPDDTNGQRQGLIAAIAGQAEEQAEISDILSLIADEANEAPDLSKHIDILGQAKLNFNRVDKHTMFICASEFSTFMGSNGMEMATFLTKMWDGENYRYKLKSEELYLSDPLVTMIGGTTPTSITSTLPPEIIGQGFMSRIIFVFAPEKAKRVARPNIDLDAIEELSTTYETISKRLSGPMIETPEAAEWLDALYETDVKIQDTRFVYYIERRHIHLIKTAMCLAALRTSMQIELEDVKLANSLLTETELYMPDALGEFGLSPLATAKQKLLEYIQHADGPIPKTVLWAIMRRDMKTVDFENSLREFIMSDKVMKQMSGIGKQTKELYVYKTRKKAALIALEG